MNINVSYIYCHIYTWGSIHTTETRAYSFPCGVNVLPKRFQPLDVQPSAGTIHKQLEQSHPHIHTAQGIKPSSPKQYRL